MKMKHTYSIIGMSCKGCKDHVEQTLKSVAGVESVEVDLSSALAHIEMNAHIEIEVFQNALEKAGGNYKIEVEKSAPEINTDSSEQTAGAGIFYCPMHCEGDKVYDKAGNCPVCGMDLLEQAALSNAQQYT